MNVVRGATDGVLEPCPSGGIDPQAHGAVADDGQPDDLGLARALTAAASGGGSLCLRRGRYELTGVLAIPSGVAVLGAGTTLGRAPGFDAETARVHLTAVTRVRLVNLRFDGVYVGVGGTATSPRNATNVDFSNLTFVDGRVAGNAQLEVNRAEDVRILRSVFSRSSQNLASVSLSAWKSAKLRIAECTWAGYLTTAINVNGGTALADGTIPPGERSEDVQIDRIDATRTPGNYDEDHGIYIWGVRGLTITRATIRGWSSTDTGGALKIRNAEQIKVTDGRFTNSGILLYTYDQVAPPYLRDVIVENNDIDMREPFLNGKRLYPGISYWRNFATTASETEARIVLRNNRVVGGPIILAPPIQSGALTLSGGCASEVMTPAEVRVTGVSSPCPP